MREVALRLDQRVEALHNDKCRTATGMTLIIPPPSLIISNVALCPHCTDLALFQAALITTPHLVPGSQKKNKKTEGPNSFGQKRRDALGFGLKPPCQRAKIAYCPSAFLPPTPPFPFVLHRARCISWGQSGRARLACVYLSEQNYTSVGKEKPKATECGLC